MQKNRKRFQRYIPDATQLKKYKVLKVFGRYIEDPLLWHMNRRSVTRAFGIGLFISYLPLIGHMFLAALCAILFRANLPIAVALVWIVNPITIVPMLTAAVLVGAKFMHIDLHGVHFTSLTMIKELWQPFVLGCLICGTLLAISGYLAMRLIWRFHTIRKWQSRQLQRQLRSELIP